MTTAQINDTVHRMPRVSKALQASKWPARQRWLCSAFLGVLSALLIAPAHAQTQATGRTVNDWLSRMHDAARERAYTGTLVVSAGENMSASRIWHVCDGQEQFERVETLTGAPRTTIRRNSEVITFVPDSRLAWVEERESLGLFPALLRTPANAIPKFYSAKEAGTQRVAGYMADVVEILPKDALRYGFRIWSEQKTGLVVKLQTLDEKGSVLEQLAFSELQLDAPVRIEQLKKQMKDTRGYEVFRPVSRKTSLEAEGWRISEGVPGFQSMGCLQRDAQQKKLRRQDSVSNGQGPARDSLQCVFSDGLTSLSLFVNPAESSASGNPSAAAMGATHSLTWVLGAYRLTLLGEAPAETLQLFASAVQRTR